MSPLGPWQTNDFDKMSWHDVHVHGFELDRFDQEQGACDLTLNIDYILEWKEHGGGYTFLVAPALLRFKSVFGLRMEVDYARPSAGMCPFSIDEIEREKVVYPTGHTSYKWRVKINWPSGGISFEAPGFDQELTGSPKRQGKQWLQRGAGGHKI